MEGESLFNVGTAIVVFNIAVTAALVGRPLLNVAEARAQDEGVLAETVCISGPVLESIEGYLRQVSASTLVIGCPRSSERHQAFGSEDVTDLGERLRQTTSAEVILVA